MLACHLRNTEKGLLIKIWHDFANDWSDFDIIQSVCRIIISTNNKKETAVSFEYEAPTVEEFKNRIKTITLKYPYV